MLGRGESAASLGRHDRDHESSIRQTKKCTENIRGSECSAFTLRMRLTPLNCSSTCEFIGKMSEPGTQPPFSHKLLVLFYADLVDAWGSREVTLA